jgi:outer membrane cobalamin receptor
MRIVGLLLVTSCLPLAGQRAVGELRIYVQDAAGLALPAVVDLTGKATHVRRSIEAAADGTASIRNLPFGVYSLAVVRAQFAPHQELVEIRSEAPVYLRVQLNVAVIGTTVVVTEKETLLDPARTGNSQYLGRDLIRDRRATVPSRAVLELVESQPGWLLEANGVLHPRGSEYNTQYVVDGIPLVDNRSPGFAPPLDPEAIQSMTVMTGNYPAEYGRKLGGLVEVTTARDPGAGLRGSFSLDGGSFDTASAYSSAQYSAGKYTVGGSINGAATDRYLDPPSERNFSNHGSLSGASGKFETDLTPADRLRFNLQQRRTRFLVPNDLSQEAAGQRQDRSADEMMGTATYQRVLTRESLLHVRMMARDIDARLWSNPLSTPILAFQDRSLREVYTNASVSRHAGSHELKVGGEFIRGTMQESFRYQVRDRAFFDDDVEPRFDFDAKARSTETSAYIQDSLRIGRLAVSAGLRFDSYRFLVRDHAFSPRLGAAWYWPRAGMVFRASYDRAFEVPAIENLLLSSSSRTREVSEETVGLPVPPSRGDFFQAGFSKLIAGRARLDAVWFRRDIRNYADDEVLLNTGVSFPITFARAHISGFEAKLEVPRWRTLSGFLSYSNLNGTGELPLTGGLFIGDEAGDVLEGRSTFRITQDQRNTAQARLRWQAAPRLWFGSGARYGSGLPFELEDGEGPQETDERVLRRVNLERGVVRPSFALDATAGADLWRYERGTVRLQLDVTNITDRLNVINFAGLLSGTALAAPRAAYLRLSADF